MRGFRSDRVNLSDTRIAYTLLLTFSLLCTIMGLLASRYDGKLRAYELDRYYAVLAECADSLDAWSEGNSEQRLSAALRFRHAVTELPHGAERETLLELADRMRGGDLSAGAEVRALAETFSLLAAFEYPEAETARQTIITTLAEVSGALFPEPDGAAEAMAEPTQYSLDVAGRVLDSLFDSVTLECTASEDGMYWVAGTDNLRLTFSAFDGSLESFVYIRLGAVPDIRCAETELVERAVRFAEGKLGLKIRGGEAIECLGGFTAVALHGTADEYRAVLDSHGRVWSMAKVKR